MTNEERKEAQDRRDRIGGYEIPAALVYEYLESAINELDGSILGSATNAVVGNHISSRKTLLRALIDIDALAQAKKKEEYGD